MAEIFTYWDRSPPVNELVAAYLEYRPPASPARSEAENDKAIEQSMRMTNVKVEE